MTETVLPLQAVEDMLKNPSIHALLVSMNPAYLIKFIVANYEDTSSQAPDWVIAGANCTMEKDVLPVCIQIFLMDWRPPK